jgi:hypothetical protein
MPDDIAVGYVVQEKVNATVVDNALFHSHLERLKKQMTSREEIIQQVSFGFNNKMSDRAFALKAFPDIPFIFSAEEDPLGFRSLRTYLLNE